MKKSHSKHRPAGLPALEEIRAALKAKGEQEAQAHRAQAFSSYEDYLLYIYHGQWKTAPHLKLICSTLESVERGEISRVIFSMPPRHGKSMSVTESFPSWYLGRHPDRRVIEVSYGAALASRFGRSNRRKLEEHGSGLFGIDIAPDNSSVTDWGIKDHSGGMLSTGWGGSITGQGADLLLIDDPVRNRQDAESELKRERLWEEWQSSISTRLHPGGTVIVIMTRWHEDDLAGRLCKADPGGWTVINLPCEAEEGDLLGREPGQPLWPERYGVDWIKRKKEEVGAYTWNSLYQGHPHPSEGGLFKTRYFRTFDALHDGGVYVLHAGTGEKTILARDCRVFQTCDVAGSLKTSADYFALGTFALTPENDLLVLDMLRTRVEGPDQPALLTRKFHEWKPVMVGVESKNMGLTTYQQLVRLGLPVVELKPNADKYTRALPAAARYSSGNVYHRNGATWRGGLEQELLDFPDGVHDDQVDVISYAVEMQMWNYLGSAGTPRDRARIIK